MRFLLIVICSVLLCCAPGLARTSEEPAGELYVVATAHLDTQWRWTIQKTITDYLAATLHDNFALFEKYPDYVFSFEGAFRYELMKEYYPAEYQRLKHYIATDRWRVAGSWLDAVDVNVPSPESLIRHTLYGNGFFRREFGKTSRDVFLPDCFGFGFALPAIAAHSGLLGFSTQKLTWGSSVGIPFDIGLWEGVDGSTVVAALNPGAYVSKIATDLSCDSTWVATVARQGELSGLRAGFKYFGTGDRGGAPTDDSVAWLTRSLAGEGPLRVRSVASDQLARDVMENLTPAQRARLPRFQGEMLMTSHGAGCYTSQAAMKRWNRQNEILADAAERASVVADWLGAATYPTETLRTAWSRFLWHQFHDDLTGTSIPEAYEFSWNDEILSLNQFAAVLTHAVGGVSGALDTRSQGVPLVVFNPLSIAREDIVTAQVDWPEDPPPHVRVFGPEGQEVPAQSQRGPDGQLRVTFLARVPALGFTVFDLRGADRPCELVTGVRADRSGRLENRRYRVRCEGLQIVSIVDKLAVRELLSGPIHLQLLANEPENWAAWEVDHADLMAPARLVGEAGVRATRPAEGPARAAIRLEGAQEGSDFAAVVSLAAGAAGNRVEIEFDIDWRTPGTLLKAAFPLAVRNELATYDLRLGTVQRGTNTPRLYEVPAQRWADLSDPDGGYGIAILNDCRYGWDRPDDRMLRLSLVHTPAVNAGWRWIDDQKSQDLGRHPVKIAICGHEGDWRAEVPWQADRLNQPLLAFQVPGHKGKLGKQFELLSVAQPGTDRPLPTVAVRAVKKAEQGDEIVLRLQELAGEDATDVTVRFARPVLAVREVNGAEEPQDEARGKMVLADGVLTVDLKPFQPRAFAVRLAEPPVRLDLPTCRPLDLPFNLDGVSLDSDRTDGDLDGRGHTIAGELLPAVVQREGIEFRTGPSGPGLANVLVCRGQRLDLPRGDFDSLYLLAAAVGGGRRAGFTVADQTTELWLQDWAAPIGQWDNRLVGGELRHDPAVFTPGYINRADAAWVGTHRHGPDGENEPYVFTHFFKYRLDLPGRAEALQLPDDPNVRILAITLAGDENDLARPVQPLYDRIDRASLEIRAARRDFVDSVQVTLWSPNPEPEIRFTRDGTAPGADSQLYTGPFTLTEGTTIRACAFSPGMSPRETAAEFTRVHPLAAAAVPDPVPGLEGRYYEGAWEQLPDFAALTPVRAEILLAVTLPPFAREVDIGLVFEGYLAAPRQGMYRLHLWSDDGSALYLAGEQVIENDGLHGRAEIAADLPLTAGLHPIRVEFFQHLGGVALELWWEGPDIPLQPVPATAFYHTE